MSRFYTIGHSTRSIAEFIELLRSGVSLLVDVRRYPGSRRHPQFNREALSESLAAAGIEYLHAPSLGGRRNADEHSPNTFWRNASFRGYADHMGTAEFQQALEQVERLGSEKTVSVMCAEAMPWQCHRQMIADALVARGHEVLHILSDRRLDAHELNPAAAVDRQGNITYPAAAGTQATLFD